MNLPDKELAIKAFWERFLIAYEENSVPDNAEMPYITYEVKTSNIGNALNLTAQLWYYSRSWAEITAKKNEIAEAIGYGHITVPIQGGYLLIRQGTPFSQRLPEMGNDLVRRIIINISCEFLTAN